METINLVVGDWSGDGHYKTSTTVVSCSLSTSDLEKAFKKGAKKLKFDITSYCEQFEDNLIPNAEYVKMREMFPALKELEFEDEEDVVEDDQRHIDADIYAALYMYTAQVGEPEMTWTKIEENKASINIGGYGLFYS